MKKEVHKERMKEVIEEDVLEFTEELFDECLATLKKRTTRNTISL